MNNYKSKINNIPKNSVKIDNKEYPDAFQAVPHPLILDQLLKKLNTVNFRELAKLNDGEPLKNKHLLIITIETILESAKNNNWGICRNHDFIYLFNGAYWLLLEDEELKVLILPQKNGHLTKQLVFVQIQQDSDSLALNANAGDYNTHQCNRKYVASPDGAFQNAHH